jgi:hypothetical protein
MWHKIGETIFMDSFKRKADILKISNDFLFLRCKIEDLISKTLIGVNVNLSELIVGNLDDEE